MTVFGQQTINGLALGSVFALYALGFSLVLANLKVFHVAHAAVFAWGGIFSWQLISEMGWPLWLGMPVSAVLSGLLNVAAYLLLIRHLENRPNKELAAFISSLGGLIALTELASLFLHNQAVRLPVDVFPNRVFRFAGLQLSAIQVLILTATAVIFVVLRWLVERTHTGRQMRSVAFDREVAAMLGTNVDRVSTMVFFVSGALAAVGATLVGVAFNIIDADLGSVYLITALTSMVIGGFGSVSGVLAGGLLVGLASSYTTAYITSSLRDVVVFGMLLAFLVVRPTGLFKVADASARA